MVKRDRLILSVGALVGVALLLSFVTAHSALPIYGSLFQSVLPTPIGQPPNNPNAITSANGGRVYCGSTQSTSWLDIPAGFTSDWGAEIHCSAPVPLENWGNQTGMWDNQGFPIGIYPATAPVVKPVMWVQEIDPVRIKGPCDRCLVGRYYRPRDKSWVDLPTAYDAQRSRVTVEIGGERPASGYPGFTDRVLVALFQINLRATVQVRATSAPAAIATDISPVSQPASTGTLTSASPAPVLTTKPLTPSPIVIGTPVEPTPTRPPATSTSASSSSAGPTNTSTPALASDTASGAQSTVALVLLGVIAVLGVAVIVMLILLIKKKPEKSKS